MNSIQNTSLRWEGPTLKGWSQIKIKGGERVALLCTGNQEANVFLRQLARLEPVPHGIVSWSSPFHILPPAASYSPLKNEGRIVNSQIQINQSQKVIDYLTHISPVLLNTQGEDTQEQIRELLITLELESMTDKSLAELKDCGLRAVSFLKAALHPSGLVFAEDFLEAFDGFSRRRLQNFVNSLWKHKAFTFVFTTWDPQEALLLADRILLINENGVAGDWTPGLPLDSRDSTYSWNHATEYLRKSLLRGYFEEKEVHSYFEYFSMAI